MKLLFSTLLFFILNLNLLFAYNTSSLKDSVVRLFITTNDHVSFNETVGKSRFYMGTGVVVNKGEVLTSASLVSNAKTIKVYKQYSNVCTTAKITKVSDKLDLALLKISNKTFIEILKPIKLKKNNKNTKKISVIGFKTGKNRLIIYHTIFEKLQKIKQEENIGFIKIPVLHIKEDLGDLITGSIILNFNQEIIGIGVEPKQYSNQYSYAISANKILNFLNHENITIDEGFSVETKNTTMIILGEK